MLRETAILGERNWGNPELRDLAVTLDVNVGRLIAVRAKKHKGVGPIAKNRRHAAMKLHLIAGPQCDLPHAECFVTGLSIAIRL
jgi:hypothetical protein